MDIIYFTKVSDMCKDESRQAGEPAVSTEMMREGGQILENIFDVGPSVADATAKDVFEAMLRKMIECAASGSLPGCQVLRSRR